jgi:hypothetical protein
LVKTRVNTPSDDSPRDKLLAERDTIYTAIRDLDFDFQTGKLLEVDYHATRDKYAARGVEILKELDALGDEPKPTHLRKQKASADEIEAAVQARRKVKAAQIVPEEDSIEAAIRARRQSASPHLQSATPGPALSRRDNASVSNQCPKCGRPVDLSDRFCAKCGASLTVEATH